MEGRMPEESAADSGKQLQGSERGISKAAPERWISRMPETATDRIETLIRG